MADQREIADHVENLVADELVLEAQRVVQHAGLAEDDGVVERAAQRQPALPQHLDFLEEPERPRRRDLARRTSRSVDLHRPLLVPEQRVIEADACR